MSFKIVGKPCKKFVITKKKRKRKRNRVILYPNKKIFNLSKKSSANKTIFGLLLLLIDSTLGCFCCSVNSNCWLTRKSVKTHV